MSEPIAAIATPPVPSAIGIVRVSGEGAIEAASAVFRAASGRPLAACESRRLVYGTLLGPDGAPIDQVLATLSRAPHSYTGEDTAELQCHGSPAVLAMALEALFAAPEKPRFFYCIPNFQNPTGKTMSLAKRRAVYALAVRYGVPVLEDDPYGELRIAGEPVPSIKSMDTEGAVIYAGSFSKILCPGMRLAYCVCDKKLMAAFVVAKQCSDVHTNVWAQRVCEAMLTRTDMDAHIREIRKIYAAKAALMMEQLDEKCPQVRYTRPEGGMFIWGTLPEGADMPAFVRECLARKLALVPGNAFMVDEEAPCGSFRMNFSTPTPENIVKGVSVMAGVLAAQGL